MRLVLQMQDSASVYFISAKPNRTSLHAFDRHGDPLALTVIKRTRSTFDAMETPGVGVCIVDYVQG